nr:hypothetical protein [Sinorhizobium meliloti]
MHVEVLRPFLQRSDLAADLPVDRPKPNGRLLRITASPVADAHAAPVRHISRILSCITKIKVLRVAARRIVTSMKDHVPPIVTLILRRDPAMQQGVHQAMS